MSKNALVTVTAVSDALSIETRPFNSVLMITKTIDIKSDTNNPIVITSAAQLLEQYPTDITETSIEYLYARDYFGASPKPTRLFVYGELNGNYNTMLSGLDARWTKNWFYTMPVDSTVASMGEVFSFIDGSSNYYVALFQSAENVTVADNLSNVKQYPKKFGFYIAADVIEKQIMNLIGSRVEFFPGSVVFSDVLLNGMTGSSYSETEKLELVGVNENSATGINICTREDQMPVVYYGKAMDGITWFDYVIAEIAIDEYMRVGLTKYLVQKNTLGNKIPANEIGRSQVREEGIRILREFMNRGILYDESATDEDGNKLFNVIVYEVANRTVELEYQVVFQGAIIKAKVMIQLSSINGN
jgi:hypothetical protein